MPARGDGWNDRQLAIRDLLAATAIHRQDALLEDLHARGFRVTQSSVSRDLREMRVAKIDGRYVVTDSLLPESQARDELTEASASILSVRLAGPHLLVVLTPPGRASVVSMAIDRARWPEVVGTVAGDDTLFVATSGRLQQAKVYALLHRATKE